MANKQLFASAPPYDTKAQPSLIRRPPPVSELNEGIIGQIEALQLQFTRRQDELVLRHKQRHDGIYHQLNQFHVS